MRLSRFRRAAIMTLTAGSLMGTSACFGSFNLTRKVYGFNKTASNDKFVRELLFLGMNIVPVYGVASFIDAVFVNTIEFWSGTNPVNMSTTIKVDSTTKVRRVALVKDGVRTMTLETYKLDKLVSTTTVRYVDGTRAMSFETVLPDGVTESHIAAISADGQPYVSSSTYSHLAATRVNAEQ
ncbi:MAG TPA: DUF3332 family protein [Gemmatimonadaceae bacterium]|jgi:hypothetical protein